MHNFYDLLLTHGAPTLLGVKPASLISIDYTNTLLLEVESYNSIASNKKIILLTKNERKAIIMLYDVIALKKMFAKRKTQKQFFKFGYKTKDLSKNLEILKNKITNTHIFPHEIGLFLGYPITDVLGFINKKECKYVGYWKVYANVKHAINTFKLYDICRCSLANNVINNVFKEEVVKYA